MDPTTCKTCSLPVRKGSDGRYYHKVVPVSTEPVLNRGLAFLRHTVVPGIDYEQIETICREVKEDATDSSTSVLDSVRLRDSEAVDVVYL